MRIITAISFVSLIILITANCQKTESNINKREAIKSLFEKYDIPKDFIDGDLSTVNIEDINLAELEAMLKEFGPISRKMVHHNRFLRKTNQMDQVLRNKPNLANEYFKKIVPRDADIIESFPSDTTTSISYKPLQYYEKKYELRANHPELYKENDLQELKGYLENIRKHLASKTKD